MMPQRLPAGLTFMNRFPFETLRLRASLLNILFALLAWVLHRFLFSDTSLLKKGNVSENRNMKIKADSK